MTSIKNGVIQLDERAAPSLVLTAALTRANDDYAKEGFLYNSALVYHGNKATALNKRENESVGKWTRRIQRFAKKKGAYAACKLGIVHAQFDSKSVQRAALIQVEHKDEGRAFLSALAEDKNGPLDWVNMGDFDALGPLDHWKERLLPTVRKATPGTGGSLLGKVLEDIPKDAKLVHIAAYYKNDVESGIGTAHGNMEDGIGQPLPLWDGSTEEGFELLEELCHRGGSLSQAEMFSVTMLVLSLELRGAIEPGEYNGCTLTFVKDGVAMIARGDRPPEDVMGKRIGHGPGTDVYEFDPDE